MTASPSWVGSPNFAPPTPNTIPRTLLFQTLGLSPAATGLHHVGKGVVLFSNQSPSALAESPSGADTVLALTRQAAAAIHLPWHQTDSLVLRRGPFLIASGLDLPAGTPLPSDATRVQNSAVQTPSQPLPPATALSSRPEASRSEAGVEGPASSPQPTTLHGTFLDLFSPTLAFLSNPTLHPGDRLFLLDPAAFPSATPGVLAASARLTGEHHTPTSLTVTLSSIDTRSPANGFPPDSGPDSGPDTTAGADHTVLRLHLPRPLRSATLDNQPLPTPDTSTLTPLLTLPASSTPHTLTVLF